MLAELQSVNYLHSFWITSPLLRFIKGPFRSLKLFNIFCVQRYTASSSFQTSEVGLCPWIYLCISHCSQIIWNTITDQPCFFPLFYIYFSFLCTFMISNINQQLNKQQFNACLSEYLKIQIWYLHSQTFLFLLFLSLHHDSVRFENGSVFIKYCN